MDRIVNPSEAGATPPVDARCVTAPFGVAPASLIKTSFCKFRGLSKKSRMFSDTFFAEKAERIRILIEDDLAPISSVEAQA